MNYRGGHGQRDTDPVLLCGAAGCTERTLGSARYCRQHLQEWARALPGGETATLGRRTDPAHGVLLRTSGGTPVGVPIAPLWSLCDHRGLNPVLTLTDGKRLYAAQGAKLTAVDHLGLIIDCAGLVPGRRFVLRATNPRHRALNVDAGPDLIRLDWPDMTAPGTVGIRFWRRLRDLLPSDTCVCCVGGHGRTGTALAALLIADGVPADEAIAKVREQHCSQAIETEGQRAYLQGLARQAAKDR